jgi:hypothetical protein
VGRAQHLARLFGGRFPAGVICTRRRLRSASARPSIVSSAAIPVLSAGVPTPTALAARPKCPCSSRAARNFNCWRLGSADIVRFEKTLESNQFIFIHQIRGVQCPSNPHRRTQQ